MFANFETEISKLKVNLMRLAVLLISLVLLEPPIDGGGISDCLQTYF